MLTLSEHRAVRSGWSAPRAVRAAAPARSAGGRSAPERVRAVRWPRRCPGGAPQAAEDAGAQQRAASSACAARRRSWASTPASAPGVRTLEGRHRRAGVTEGDRMSDLPKSVEHQGSGSARGLPVREGRHQPGRQDLAGRRALRHRRLKPIEFTSFVSPKWVPQMADAEQMVAGIRRVPASPTRRSGSTRRGSSAPRRLRESLALRPMFSVAGTDTFTRKNTNRSRRRAASTSCAGLGRALPEARHGLARRRA